jgi:hypothetical protein
MDTNGRLMDTDAAADELYGLLPEQFTSRRAELSAEARAQGDGAARAQLAAMRRPTVAAWAVNLLVREHGADVENLLRIAAELRTAQRALDGNRLRELSHERRSCVATLSAATRSVTAAAGRPVNDAVLREVQATLDAAVADENAESAVRTGRLTTALTYSGFGEVDISAAVAASNARPRLAVVPPEDRSDAGALSRVEQRRGGMSTNAVADREREVEQARTRLAEVTERRDVLLADAEQLRRRLNDVEQQLRPTEAEFRSARRRLETAQRALSQASERLTRGHRT